MDFRTPVTIPESTFRIDHSTGIMLLGSCFSENMGSKLQKYKFQVNVNPFGIVYNPFSAAAVINRLLSNRNFRETDLVFHNDVYQSFLHHGRFSHPDKNKCMENISRMFAEAAAFISRTDVFFITFGTAYVYKLKSTGEVVVNCHRFPPGTFIRERLTVRAIVKEWSGVINTISALNPAARFIFTVSPIRHWKDGAHENQISKSILHLAIAELQEMFTSALTYFPAYEILLDELRDYRFFAEDMMHPSDVATNYIWERFCETFFRRETHDAISEWNQISRSLCHAPLNKSTESYHQFLKQTLQKLILFRQNHPRIDCHRETEELTKKINQ